MKPLKLELQAFGPYVSKQTVDFEKLSGKGMFLIKGNTGSGKTTIFDAMTFALYGGGSGESDKVKVGRNDLEEWRCTQADKTLDTYVSFQFSSHGRQYIFKRILVKKVKNCVEHYEAGEIDKDGNVIPFFENPKKDDLTKKAIELIGLTKEQFRQVVLLPQGQFERFLTASSGDKEEILQKIFGSERWSKYAYSFYETAYRKKASLDDEKRVIQSSLAEDGVSGIDELAVKIETLEEKKQKNIDEHEKFGGTEKQEKLTRDIRLAERFRALHELETKKKQLKDKLPEIRKKSTEYAQAQLAESLRGQISEFESASLDYKSRKKTLAALAEKIEYEEKSENDAKILLEEHVKNSPVDAVTRQIGNLEEKRSVYEELGKLNDAFRKAEAEWKTAENMLETTNISLEAAESSAINKKDLFDAADKTAKAYRDRYFAGIYGEIAQALRDGEKCPVCGNTVHPEPAKKLPDSVSKQEVESKEKETEKARKAWDKAEKERSDTEKKRQECCDLLAEKSKKRESSKADLESAKKNLAEGIEDLDGLDAKISELKNIVSEYADKTEKLRNKHTNASDILNDLRGQCFSALSEMENAEKRNINAAELLEKLVREKGYDDYLQAKSMLADDSVRSDLHKEIVEYETQCEENAHALEEKLTELSGLEEPDSKLFAFRQSEIRNENDTFLSKDAALKAEIDRLRTKLKDLSEKNEHYSSEIVQAENDFAFAKKLRGDTGIGLQRYVLAIMFSQVINEANRMLSRVHGGRYHLFRTDDKAGGNKRGLELKVHDSRCPEDADGRSVSMLSGGEKFLVSLALSIGMSAVAQRSGVQIEALFIDEGFGTLDDSSINDAMDVLDSVRKGNGMIGIISHVQVLEANIPTHLEVVKSESGSTIIIN